MFRTVAGRRCAADAAHGDRLRSLVVLATGGARGITAEALRELALPGNTLILTGRSPLVDEAAPTRRVRRRRRRCASHFIAEVRSGAAKLKPAEIQRKTAAVMAGREMRANIDDFRRRGATVEYHVVDVLDECALAHLIADVESPPRGDQRRRPRRRRDRGQAARRQDRRELVARRRDQGARPAAAAAPPAAANRCASSRCSARSPAASATAASRDYATANELMNRLCCQLRDQWRGRVEVNALCWGPWGPTQFGAGMVTAETEAKFAAKGVTLVDAASGRQLFVDAVSARRRAARSRSSAARARGRRTRPRSGRSSTPRRRRSPTCSGRCIGAGRRSPPRRPASRSLAVTLDARHHYLDQHRIDGVPVLPAAAAMALMGDAARTLWPGWKVVETRDFRLIKGVEMKEAARALQVVIQPPPYGSSEGFEVNGDASAPSSAAGRSLVHYRAVVRLEQQVPGEFARSPALARRPRS